MQVLKGNERKALLLRKSSNIELGKLNRNGPRKRIMLKKLCTQALTPLSTEVGDDFYLSILSLSKLYVNHFCIAQTFFYLIVHYKLELNNRTFQMKPS